MMNALFYIGFGLWLILFRRKIGIGIWLDRREEAYAIIGIIIVALGVVISFFNITAATISQYTTYLMPLSLQVIRLFMTMVGTFMIVLGWRVTRGYTNGLLSKFGRPSDKPHKYFWLEVVASEAAGIFLIYSVFILSPISSFHSSQFSDCAVRAIGAYALGCRRLPHSTFYT